MKRSKNKTKHRSDAQVAVGDLVRTNMVRYGTHTILNRAIPMLYDGLKPVHRRIVFNMYRMGLTSNVAHRKSAKIVGETMGASHPHGDLSIYGAMVGLSTGNGSAMPLIDGQGNWGNFNTTGPTRGAASSRYTEARLTKYASDCLVPKLYMDNAVTPYVDNYDGTLKDPLYLPAQLPNIFLMGSEGIATGVTVNMPAYTYSSVVTATKLLLSNNGNAKKAVKKLKLSDRWGAVPVEGQDAELSEYHTKGIGRIVWTVPYTITKERGSTIITLTNMLPANYETWKGSLERIKGVYDVKNLSDKNNPIHISIVVRDDAALPAVKKRLEIAETYRSAVTVIKDESATNEEDQVAFRQWSPVQILEEWYSWRIALEKRFIKSLIRDNDAEIKRLELMVHAANHLDTIFEILKAKSGDKVAMIEKRLKVNNEDAKTIWQLAISRLDKLNVDDTKAKLKALKADNVSLKADYKQPVDRIIKSLDALPDFTFQPKSGISKTKRKKAA